VTSERRSGSAEYARILEENERYTEVFNRAALGAAPMSGIAIVACMDARLDIEEALGLRTGDAHIIRNAGGLATDDAIRSLIVSQRLLGTDEVIVIEHTGCGLLNADSDALRRRLATESGSAVDIELGEFDDLEANLRDQVERIRTHPWLREVPVHGLIFEVETGRLREVL
jgi:carbonic anhydrase